MKCWQCLRQIPSRMRRRTARSRSFWITRPQPTHSTAFRGRQDELLALGLREIYVHYGSGMGTTKLKIPAAKLGTARNLNTVAKLAAMASALRQ